jgi:hypothetical protein
MYGFSDLQIEIRQSVNSNNLKMFPGIFPAIPIPARLPIG